MSDHEHTCRRCGSGIVCNGDGDFCWEGDNIGCPNEEAEYATEAAQIDKSEDDRAAMNIDPNPPGVTLRPFTPAEMAAFDDPDPNEPRSDFSRWVEHITGTAPSGDGPLGRKP